MNLNKKLILLLLILVALVVAGCDGSTGVNEDSTGPKYGSGSWKDTIENLKGSDVQETPTDSDKTQQDEDCNNYYLTKFGIGLDDITVINTECEWSPNDRYGVVDLLFKAQIKDSANNDYNIFYKKGCCHRRAYHGFTMCIMSQNGETELFKDMKSEICNKLNNQFGDFTTQCENGQFEKKIGNSIILSLKNDYVYGAGSDIKTVSIESNNCLDIS